ncbi:MAG: FAD:protein FMN transferase [Flavobacteriales bacterium]|nr:FAD:protein FMN transferase [Flavobacteriales bacterium]
MKGILLIAIVIFFSACQPNKKQEFVFQGEAQGTSYTVKYINNQELISLKSSIDSLLLAIDNSMSTYKPSSRISALNKGEKIEMDKMFQTVFQRSIEINKATDGAFDPTIGPLISAWGFNFENPMHLDSLKVDSLKNLCGFDKFEVNQTSLMKVNSNASLNFNAIAQGYSVDLMAEVLEIYRIDNFYVELGGELKVKGKNKNGVYWRIGIDKPVDENLGHELSHIISLNNKAMATSGNYRKFYEINGEKYSHTLSPKTGYPVKHKLLSATVIAEDCIDADAYGTSFMVLGLEKSKEILKLHPELQAVLIYAVGDSLKSYYSDAIAKQIVEL